MRDQKTCKMENTLTFQNSVLCLYTLCRPLVDVYSCEPFNNIVNIHIPHFKTYVLWNFKENHMFQHALF